MNIILIIVGFVLLIKCADYLVDGASNVAKALGIPPLVVGLTVVSLGTSAPEAAVSVTASIKNMNTMSLGNVVGSNICNLLLVLGASSLFGKVTAKKEVIKRDFVYVLIATATIFLLALEHFIHGRETGIITRTNGLVLLLFLAIYLYTLIRDAKYNKKTIEEQTKFSIKDIFLIIIGVAGIILGGNSVVDGATNLATNIGVSENVVALTIVAVGTSLPELVTSVVAVKKNQSDIAIGNVLGSNLFNILFILGLSSSISPITYGLESFVDIIFMLSITVLVFLLFLRHKNIGRYKGIFLLILYFSYMTYILFR